MIHCGLFDTNGVFLYWLIAIYAFNHLEQRKILWKELEDIHNSQQGPWCLIGDFNNVLKATDRMGGKIVHESEYVDLASFMETAGLSGMDCIGDCYTWSNKQVDSIIYSKLIGSWPMWIGFNYTLTPPSLLWTRVSPIIPFYACLVTSL
ncbi:hypothetical protein QL285_086402 [Trifolium repens]|nr:hypothetical protein QL285_086402 [Trifolium repens]